MKPIALLPFLTAALCAQSYGPDVDVPGKQIMSGQGALRGSGVLVRYKTMVSSPTGGPVTRGQGVGGGLWMENDHVTRLVLDPKTSSWFGYDVGVAGDSASGFLLTFGPPTARPDKEAGGKTDTVVPLAKYPAPQTIRDGDTVAVDLMVSADGTQKLTDYIQIVSANRDPWPVAATTTAEPRDFTLDDGPVNYNFHRIVVLWQGQTVKEPTYTGRPGATFWVALPGQGRYILSLTPHDGFTKSGAVRDNVMAFDASGQPCEVRFLTPVAGDGKAWNLYVRHDAGYMPKPLLKDNVVTGTGRIDELLR
jgi:hypothetical protein